MDVAVPNAPVFLPRRARYYVGCDLGQSSDPTALAVLEHVRGVMDAGSEWERHTGLSTHLQTPAERINVRHLERLPLGMSYPSVVAHVADLLSRPPLTRTDDHPAAELVIDSTGVGKAVADIFSDAGLKFQAVTITAGNEATWAGQDRWNVAKTILISTLDAMLHIKTLRFASALSEADAMKDELLDFRRKLSETGRSTYAARSGRHDDLVLAVAIACWWINNEYESPMAMQGTYGKR